MLGDSSRERERDQFRRLMEDSRFKMMADWSKVDMEEGVVVAFWVCSEDRASRICW